MERSSFSGKRSRAFYTAVFRHEALRRRGWQIRTFNYSESCISRIETFVTKHRHIFRSRTFRSVLESIPKKTISVHCLAAGHMTYNIGIV